MNLVVREPACCSLIICLRYYKLQRNILFAILKHQPLNYFHLFKLIPDHKQAWPVHGFHQHITKELIFCECPIQPPQPGNKRNIQPYEEDFAFYTRENNAGCHMNKLDIHPKCIDVEGIISLSNTIPEVRHLPMQ